MVSDTEAAATRLSNFRTQLCPPSKTSQSSLALSLFVLSWLDSDWFCITTPPFLPEFTAFGCYSNPGPGRLRPMLAVSCEAGWCSQIVRFYLCPVSRKQPRFLVLGFFFFLFWWQGTSSEWPKQGPRGPWASGSFQDWGCPFLAFESCPASRCSPLKSRADLEDLREGRGARCRRQPALPLGFKRHKPTNELAFLVSYLRLGFLYLPPDKVVKD